VAHCRASQPAGPGQGRQPPRPGPPPSATFLAPSVWDGADGQGGIPLGAVRKRHHV